ncbi:hypothetical protein BGZ47_003453 [Haplosporangium gracile]|nr:hypothetical protein BGZ47_003453 [Haplosporangium gracile]
MDSASEQQYDPTEAMSGRQPYLQSRPAIEVIIAGRGLTGLLLDILLHKVGASFTILERASSIKPLDLLEDLQRISKSILTTNMYREEINKLGVFEVKESTEINGFDNMVFPGPNFYDNLLSRIPSDKLLFCKKVLKIEEMTRDNKVEIACADSSKYQGDVLVGADGAYSSVRQCLADLKCGFVTVVGATDPLDLEKYLMLKDEYSFFSQVIGDSEPYSLQFDSVKFKKELSQTSKWGTDNNDAMINGVNDFGPSLGATMGELIRATPRDRISRIFLKKKLLPQGNEGAVNAMQDATILRYEHVKYHFNSSTVQGRVLFGQTMVDKAIRYAALNWVPNSMQKKKVEKTSAYRPLITYLPTPPKRGTIEVLPRLVIKLS